MNVLRHQLPDRRDKRNGPDRHIVRTECLHPGVAHSSIDQRPYCVRFLENRDLMEAHMTKLLTPQTGTSWKNDHKLREAPM